MEPYKHNISGESKSKNSAPADGKPSSSEEIFSLIDDGSSFSVSEIDSTSNLENKSTSNYPDALDAYSNWDKKLGYLNHQSTINKFIDITNSNAFYDSAKAILDIFKDKNYEGIPFKDRWKYLLPEHQLNGYKFITLGYKMKDTFLEELEKNPGGEEYNLINENDQILKDKIIGSYSRKIRTEIKDLVKLLWGSLLDQTDLQAAQYKLNKEAKKFKKAKKLAVEIPSGLMAATALAINMYGLYANLDQEKMMYIDSAILGLFGGAGFLWYRASKNLNNLEEKLNKITNSLKDKLNEERKRGDAAELGRSYK